MIIDFHTHAFPDKIAHKTVDMLAQKANIPKFRDGAVSDCAKAAVTPGLTKASFCPLPRKAARKPQ